MKALYEFEKGLRRGNPRSARHILKHYVVSDYSLIGIREDLGHGVIWVLNLVVVYSPVGSHRT